MIELELCGLYGDVADLAQYVPDSADDFAYLLSIAVCPAGAPSVETFRTMVCTPRWLARAVQREPVLNGQHHLIVERHDPSALRSFVEGFIRNIRVDTWSDVMRRMDGLARWADEYPDDAGHHMS